MIDTLQNMPAEDRSIISLESICIATQLKRTMAKRTRNQFATSQVDANIVADESPFILKETPCDLQEISTAVMIPTIEFVASKSVKLINAPTSPQKPLSDTRTVYESPPVLVQVRPEISEISTATVNPSDTETTEKILASGPRKWPVPTPLSEPTVVNQSPSVSLQKPSQMQENCSISSPCTPSPAHNSRP